MHVVGVVEIGFIVFMFTYTYTKNTKLTVNGPHLTVQTCLPNDIHVDLQLCFNDVDPACVKVKLRTEQEFGDTCIQYCFAMK